ncbi:hypothetical protein OXPF_31080 [Oxobacter pfennigii]|uniref:DUF3787 domain-containing protein n=1 Tax=Oxobacter pfennigii TaxID=36849 RepID=A0A0P8W7A2_9CLOT|nr:DUF3787 domain-containing protein [Oxobacter pfennigii]KPU43666.1 hypothetical protein OXPF_31080 [Oxobacter pfennigii]
MSKNKNKKTVPVETHDTAAWANIAEQKPVSNVSIPNKSQVENAKEWVDSNEK